VLDRFIDALSSTAMSIRQICLDEGMPRSQDIFIACGRDPAVRARIAQAREAQQDVIVDELLEIADTCTPEEVNHAKLRIWTRQWAAARFAPKKYGEKQQVEVQHSLSETAAQVLMDLSARAKERRQLEAKCIDVTPTPVLEQGGAGQQDQQVTADCTGSEPIEAQVAAPVEAPRPRRNGGAGGKDGTPSRRKPLRKK
jgi:hypothetical protein